MPDPIILDSFELWQMRAFEQGDEATGTMLGEIRDGCAAGFVPEGNARIAVNSARKRLDPANVVHEYAHHNQEGTK